MKQMPVTLGCIYSPVQSFEGSGRAGDLMAVEEGKGIKFHLIQIFGQQTSACAVASHKHWAFTTDKTPIHAESASPQNDRIIKAQGATIQIIRA